MKWESIRGALTAIGIIAGLALLCGGWLYWERISKPPIDPIAETEKDFLIDTDDDYVIQTEVRQTALEFAKQNLSGWTIKGLSCASQGVNIFSVAFDVEKDGQNLVVLATGRKYFRDKGDPYWRITLDDPNVLAKPSPFPSMSPSPLSSR